MCSREEFQRLMMGEEIESQNELDEEENSAPATAESRQFDVKKIVATDETVAVNQDDFHDDEGDLNRHLPFRRVKYDWKQDILKQKDEQVQSSKMVGPVKPSKFESDDFVDDISYGSQEENNEKSNEDSQSSFDEDEIYKELDFTAAGIPFTHQANLSGHDKNITCIAIDHVGTRMFTGAHDYKLRIWDLPNMDRNMNCFRVLVPNDSQPITAMDFNHRGNICLVVGSNAKPKILNREGRNELELMKGDMYLRDQHHTKGHTGVVTSGWWHPTNHQECVTSSLDGSIRIWDTTMNCIGVEQHLPNRDVITCRSEKGLPTGVWKCNLTPDGSKILAATQDGSYFVYSSKNKYSSAEITYRSPYKFEVTAIQPFSDNQRFLARCQDNTMRLFDIRKLDRPAYTWYELPNNSPNTGVCLSPDERYIVTGTSNTKNTPGCLAFFDLNSSEEIARVPIMDNKITAVHWEPQLNQLYVGAGPTIKVFYDPQLSRGGIMKSVVRDARRITDDDMQYEAPIMTPYALPMFNTDHRYKKKNLELIRGDAKQSKKPEVPLTGAGKGGKVANGPTTITQLVIRTAWAQDTSHKEDPVASLYKHAEASKANAMYIDRAYKVTQPKPILDYTAKPTAERELMKQNKKCPRCGLTQCQCNSEGF